MKSVPISVRISQEEAETLARLRIPGATTPSEKLRALITEAHHREQGPADYSDAIAQVQQWLAPLFQTVQLAESQGQHSDILAVLREWLPDFLAYARLAGHGDAALTREELRTLERGIADRLFRLMERLFQLALISRCHCYDPELITKRMELIRQLATIITLQQERNKEAT
ncbi:MAG TPA: hypothetical protein VGE00_06170 [Gammaproteobacteria bacterium]